MRFEQQISAYSSACGGRRADPVPVRFRPPGVRFRTESRAAPQTPTPAQAASDRSSRVRCCRSPPTRRCRWRSRTTSAFRAQRLSPQIQALLLSQTRAAYAPLLFSNTTKNSNSSPPSTSSRATTSPPARVSGTTRASSSSSSGAEAGTRRRSTARGARPAIRTDAFNPRLSSNFNFNFTQPLLRDFSIDSTRQQLLIGQKQQEIVDVQLQQQVTQTARAVRNAYYDLVGAIGQLEVARESLELANESLRNNERRVEVGTMAPIDIVEAEAEVARNEEAVIIDEARDQEPRGRAADAHHEPVAAGLLDGAARAGGAAGADAAGGRRRGRDPERAREPHRPGRRRANSSSRPTSASSSRRTRSCRRSTRS